MVKQAGTPGPSGAAPRRPSHASPSGPRVVLVIKRSAWRTYVEEEKDPRVKKLAELLTSPEVKQFIDEKYQGAVLPAF